MGFAAETERVVASASAKREAKHADLIVANDVSRADAGFEVDTNEVTIVGPDGAEALPLQSKSRVAGAILDRVEKLITVRLKADTTYEHAKADTRRRSGLAGPSSHGPRSTHRTSDIRQGARRIGRQPGSGLAPAAGDGRRTPKRYPTPFLRQTSPPIPLIPVVEAAAEKTPDPFLRLAAVRQDIGDCTRCKLHGLGRKQIVFGVGNPDADLMFVGEAPGGDEDIQGIPFVGRAGQLLTKIIEAIGLARDDVYIANVIKCRPPQNRNPEQDEVETCEPFLFRQIDIIKPKVIVALGTFAARTLLRTLDPISRLRGRVFEYRGAKLIPTFHPAYLLRNPASKREVWEDMKMAQRAPRRKLESST